MLNLNSSGKFKKDLKTCVKRGYDIKLLDNIVNTLRIPAPLPPKHRDHTLSSNFNNRRECHITPDWLLIYEASETELYLDRTGTHSDLFR